MFVLLTEDNSARYQSLAATLLDPPPPISIFPPPFFADSLGQIGEQDLQRVLAEMFLEDRRERQQLPAATQLGALQHALLVEHEEVGAARQDERALGGRAREALGLQFLAEALHQVRQVPGVGGRREM